jgi:hypothetical protein
MKNLIFIVVVSSVVSCTGTTTGSKESNTNTASTTNASSLSYPFNAHYSSKISIGKDSNSLLVLNSYKAWEMGDMNALANTLSDSVYFNFSDGTKFAGLRDSAVAMAKKYRDSLSSVKIDMDVWIPVHSDDRNEDAVLAWYKETDTYKNGKVDSVYFSDINGLKNGKIDFIQSHAMRYKK